jgi:CDGSH-type Zn-finger protein
MTNKNNAPLPLNVEAGKTYGWCSCGHSLIMPLCDGTHREVAPDKRAVKFVAEETRRVFLCGCGKTGNAPFCDETHLDL